jgi:hypothetical protein
MEVIRQIKSESVPGNKSAGTTSAGRGLPIAAGRHVVPPDLGH